MRKAIRDVLANPANVPSVAGRVFEPGQAKEDTPRPYLVVEEGAQDGGTSWGTHAEQVTIFIEGPQTGSNGKTALRLVDQIEREIKAALDNRVITDEDTGERIQLVYSGNAGPDVVPPPLPGEFPPAVRSMLFTAFTLKWRSQLTLLPDPITGLVGIAQGGYSEVQTVSLGAPNPSAGTFTLTHGANTTPPLAYNASAGTVQAVLEALPPIGAGNVLVEGNAGGPWTLRFRSGRANQNLPQTTVNGASLTTLGTPSATTSRDGTGLQTDGLVWNPADASPGLYWRVSQFTELERTNWGIWSTCMFRGHVITNSDEARQLWVRRIAEYLTSVGRVRISDGSPMLLLQVGADFEADAFREGQLAVVGRYGVKREQMPGLLPVVERLNNSTLETRGISMTISYP